MPTYLLRSRHGLASSYKGKYSDKNLSLRKLGMMKET